MRGVRKNRCGVREVRGLLRLPRTIKIKSHGLNPLRPVPAEILRVEALLPEPRPGTFSSAFGHKSFSKQLGFHQDPLRSHPQLVRQTSSADAELRREARRYAKAFSEQILRNPV